MNNHQLLNDYWFNPIFQASEQGFQNFSNAISVEGVEDYSLQQVGSFSAPSMETPTVFNSDSFDQSPIANIALNEPTYSQPVGGVEDTLVDDDLIPTISDNLSPVEDVVDDAGVAEDVMLGAETVADPIAGVVLAADMIAQGIGSSIAQSKVASYNNEAYTQYNQAMATGHGIGFQSLAGQNLQNSLTASSLYSTNANLIGTIFGPAGAIFASFSNPSMFDSAPVTNFNAETPSGEIVNAQDISNINADSYADTTN